MSSGGHAVGIDLGTSNTVAIVRFPDGRTRPVLFDGQPVLPSAVFLDYDGNLQVGRDAQRMAQLDPARFEPNPKRRIDEDMLLLGDRELPITEVLAAPLRAVARAVTDTVGHLPSAVITCPAAWGTARKERLQQAAIRAGWPPVHLMAEPIAAARHFTETQRRPVPPGSVLAIFDFGGGTLDVALVRNDGATFTVVGSGGAEDLGGLDIDAAIVAHLGQILAAQHPHVWAQITRPTDELARRNRRMFWDDVRAAKEMLSRSTAAPIPVPGVSASLHLTRDELDHLATPLVRRATGELSRALRQANLAPGNLCGIFLVGGTSRVPLVSRLLHAETGIAPTVLEQPELPVAEGAVAGSVAAAPAPRAAPVSGAAPMPVSGTPVSSLPTSGSPVSAAPSSGGAPTHAPQPRPYITVAPPHMAPPMPQHMPQQVARPVPAGPMWVTTGPPPRPPRRYRAWPWLLTIVLVMGAACYGGYLIIKATSAEPLEREQTITIDDLAPAGFRRAIVTSSWAHAIGQRVDGTVEVASVQHGSTDIKRHRSTKGGGWATAIWADTWVVVLSVPAGDGTRTMMVTNPVDDVTRELTIGNGETVRIIGPDNGNLGYVVYSEARNTARYGIIGAQVDQSGQPVALPAGARPLRGAQGTDLHVIDSTGRLSRFSRNGLAPVAAQTTAGQPAGLTYFDGVAGVWYAENKTAYRVMYSGTEIFQGAGGRQPVWVGRCGESDQVCVVDEEPDNPASRHLIALDYGGAGPRTPVPYAELPETVDRAAEFVFVPTKENGRPGTAVADVTRGTANSYFHDVRLRDGQRLSGGKVDALMIPTGTAADWATTAQSLTLRGVDLTSDDTTDVATVTVIPASCDVRASRLACATDVDFGVWKVDEQ